MLSTVRIDPSMVYQSPNTRSSTPVSHPYPHSNRGASSLLGATTGFIGFSDVVGPASLSPSTPNEAGAPPTIPSLVHRSSSASSFALPTSSVSATPFYAGEDADLRVVCKRLGKKDGVTKHKALAELSGLVAANPGLVEGLLPFWLYVYPRLAVLEDDRRIREALFASALPQLFAANRKCVLECKG